MEKSFLGKYFPPSMVSKMRNDITKSRQRPLRVPMFEAWEPFIRLSIDRFPNHNMLPVTQIDTFYNGLTLRHRDTINATTSGTFMKRRPEECYDLIENMTAHHNDWDTSAQRNESSSSITSSNLEIASLKLQISHHRWPKSERICLGNLTIKEVTLSKEIPSPRVRISLPSTPFANPKCELKPLPTQVGLVLDGPYVPIPPSFINPEEDEREDEILIDQDNSEFTIKVPPPSVQQAKPPKQNEDIVISSKGILVTCEYPILRDGNERLILNMRNDTSSYSSEPHQESINTIDVYNVSHEEIHEDLFVTNHPSGNPTSSLTSHTNLTSPEVNDDIFDLEVDIIENLLNLNKTKC
ncbi:hypothetical protein Tco_1022860 [Tanacetum coccineum]